MSSPANQLRGPNHCLLTVGELGDVATYDGGAWSAPEEILHARGLAAVDRLRHPDVLRRDRQLGERTQLQRCRLVRAHASTAIRRRPRGIWIDASLVCLADPLSGRVQPQRRCLYVQRSDWSRQNLNGSQAMASLRSPRAHPLPSACSAVVTL